ncbi:hypothetical protein U1Q18_001211, partial [Sarracenia purpurea var. burkii]
HSIPVSLPPAACTSPHRLSPLSSSPPCRRALRHRRHLPPSPPPSSSALATAVFLRRCPVVVRFQDREGDDLSASFAWIFQIWFFKISVRVQESQRKSCLDIPDLLGYSRFVDEAKSKEIARDNLNLVFFF